MIDLNRFRQYVGHSLVGRRGRVRVYVLAYYYRVVDVASYYLSLKYTYTTKRATTWYHHLHSPCRGTQQPIDRAEATHREVSSWVGDHQRIYPVVWLFFFWLWSMTVSCTSRLMAADNIHSSRGNGNLPTISSQNHSRIFTD